MIQLCCLLLALGLASALPVTPNMSDSEYRNAFSQYQKREGKIDDDHEVAARFEAFKTNLNFVNQHNVEAAMGKHTYTLKCNKFCDLTNAEYRSRFLSLK